MTSLYYLIRHGETAWSKSGQHTGKSEITLTDHGEAEARSLSSRLSGIAFSKVLVSPRVRAMRTCELAGFAGAAQVEQDLAEWDYGHYEGKTMDEIKRLVPGWSIYRDGCPGGESPSDIAARADRLIGRLRGLEGTVALFSHGHFGRVLAARWIGLDVDFTRRFSISTASVGILSYDLSNPDSARIVSWNQSP